jgi:hypothetical protein
VCKKLLISLEDATVQALLVPRQMVSSREVLRADRAIVRFKRGGFDWLRHSWRRRIVLIVRHAKHRGHVWRWHWKQRIYLLAIVIRIIRVELIQQLHLRRVIVGVVQVPAQELWPREALAAHATVVALIDVEMFEGAGLVGARVQVVHVTRQMVLFAERLVAELAHRALLAVDDDV